MKGYFKNKLGVIPTVELEKNNAIEKDNGGIEKVRVNMITSSCSCCIDLTDFLLQDIDKEITLVNVIEPDDSLSHINALYEEVRFKDIQNKVFAEVKKDIDMLLQHKSDLLEKNGPSLTNSGTRQGLMDQIAILKGELEEKNRQISALLNIISSKSSTENPSRPLQDTVSPWKPEETSKHVAEFANCTPPAYRDFDTPKKNFLQTNNINGEVSQHSNGNSDVQLKNNLNIIISKKVRKLNREKQLIFEKPIIKIL